MEYKEAEVIQVIRKIDNLVDKVVVKLLALTGEVLAVTEFPKNITKFEKPTAPAPASTPPEKVDAATKQD